MPVIATSASIVASSAKLLQLLQNRNNEAMRKIGDEAVLAYLQEVSDQLARLGLGQSELVSRLDNVQLAHLFANMEFEARREALPDRRGLLACVTANLVASNWDIHRKARVERCFRQLDVSDVLLLRALAPSGLLPSSPYARAIAIASHEDWNALRHAGCIYERSVASVGGGHQEVYFTPIGYDVLEASSQFQASEELEELRRGCAQLAEDARLWPLASIAKLGLNPRIWSRWADGETQVGWALDYGPEPQDFAGESAAYSIRLVDHSDRKGWRTEAIAVRCHNHEFGLAVWFHFSPR